MFAPRLASLLVLISLFFSACGSEPQVFQGPLVISFADAPTSLSPLSYSAQNRRVLTQIYEPLLSLDADFNLRTALAVSWGRLDDMTWELRLRKNVVFQDGRPLTADDVVYSLDLARAPDSEMAALLASLDSVSALSDDRVHLVTRKPDPLLLQKLTNVLIFPKDFTDFDNPVGTGPYRLLSYSSTEDILERNPSYWGPAPFFEELVLRFEPDPDLRFVDFQAGKVQLLGNLPPQHSTNVQSPARLVSYPGLELSSMMLNVQRLHDIEIRQAIVAAMDTDYSAELGSGYLKPAHQLSTTGLLGYDDQFTRTDGGLAEAVRLLDGRELPVLHVAFPDGLEALRDRMTHDLEEAGFVVSSQMFPLEDYENEIFKGQFDLYFFGWKFDLGDMADFMDSVAHTKRDGFGAFNGMNYSNSDVDALLDAARVEFDLDRRVELLHQAQDVILSDHVIEPLFEAQGLYAVRSEIQWEPRLDGQILASEILGNLVE